MLFTTLDYFYFFLTVLILYWIIPGRTAQNILLLAVSYIFYGWIHPWFCILLGTYTVVTYACGRAMGRYPDQKRIFLIICLVINIALLAVFKYFNFFVDNIHALLSVFGLSLDPFVYRIILPIGISFYTFQTIGYIIDIYWGKLEPCENFLDFSLFVAFFPQVLLGPIERGGDLLPQIEKPRLFNSALLGEACSLLIRGYIKKLIIADNVKVFADKVFMLETPSLLLLLAGGFAFTIQMYADFSAYTDIARGSGKLLGFNLTRNFNSPYLAVSPQDYWNRWHMTFYSWVKDYIFTPLLTFSLRISKVRPAATICLVLILTMFLSGLWHGAGWTYIFWGLYYGILTSVYHLFGMGANWRPDSFFRTFIAWSVMFLLTVIAYIIFRASDISWLANVLTHTTPGFSGDSLTVSLVIIALVLFYSIPFLVLLILDRVVPDRKWIHSIVYGFAIVAIVLFFIDAKQDFVYFQF